MQNCRVRLLQRRDTLAFGHRVAGEEIEIPVMEGPAHFSAPRSAWERQAALEKSITGHLIVHTIVNLGSVTAAEIQGHNAAGQYEVLDASGSGTTWTLTLGGRAVSGRPAVQP